MPTFRVWFGLERRDGDTLDAVHDCTAKTPEDARRMTIATYKDQSRTGRVWINKIKVLRSNTNVQ